ncbi:MAG: glycosyltransferase family 2 protein [Fibrobacter sp.]|nr:glycosyltransferase family 2 protein [Fibrobacter sp.]
MSASISIILPVYNAEKYLRECVDSVLKIGERLDWELILVDDGSKDSSPSICDSFAEVNSRVRVSHLENGGVSNARNVGMAAATKDFVTFIDADDWIDADAFVSTFQKFIGYSCELGFTSFIRVEKGQGRERLLEFGESRRLTDSEKMTLLQTRLAPGIRFMGSVWRNFYLRKLASALSFDTTLRFQEDVLFNIAAINNAANVAIVNKSFYYYRVNEDSANFNKSTNSVQNRIAAWERMAEWSCENGVDLSFALMCRHCPIYARLFANASREYPRGIKRIKALWKIHREIPRQEIRQWKPEYFGNSFLPYVLLRRIGLDLLGFVFLFFRFLF